MEIKDQIKRSISITDLISSYGIELKPAGKNYKALCPFHSEKTPSFFAKPESDHYSCYGCNKFGDIFSFVQEMENIGFREAIDFLIERFNLQIDRKAGRGSKKFEKKNIYYEINNSALKYFVENFRQSPEGRKALEYVKNRGISPDTIHRFSLGYAKDSWTGLLDHLKGAGVDLKVAETVGLIIKNEKGEYYDRFRGRIIFPICSETGKVIAFGGRTVIDDKAKYLNSPESPVYTKGKTLYGFNITKEFIRPEGTCVLVEGNFDVISLFEKGIKNVTASLGTALTPEQIYILKRYSKKIYFAYDNDEAGINAMIRGIERMFEQNINPHIVSLGKYKDPDEFIIVEGSKRFQELFVESKDGFRYLLERLAKKYKLSAPEEKKRAVEETAVYISKFENGIVRDGYKNIASDFFNVDESFFRTQAAVKVKEKSSPDPLKISPAERVLLTVLLHKPGYIDEVEQFFSEKTLDFLSSGNILRSLFKSYRESTSNTDFRKISSALSPAESSLVGMLLMEESPDPDTDKMEDFLESSILSLIGVFREKELNEIGKKIRRAERENRLEEVKKLLVMKTKILDRKYPGLRAGGNIGNSH